MLDARNNYYRYNNDNLYNRDIARQPDAQLNRAVAKTVKLNKKLGEGAFGQVHLGENAAIKLVNRNTREGADNARALKNEYAALEKCKVFGIPHVIDVFDYQTSLHGKYDYYGKLIGVKDTNLPDIYGQKYDAMRMKCADGGTLENLVKKRKFSEAECRKLATILLETLIPLHSDACIVHRDLKPANIMIDQGKLVLIDFGIAKDVYKDGFAKSNVGTPYFMAPEVFKADRFHPYNGKADLWSLGVILYYCRYGVYPFDATDMAGLSRKIDYHTRNPHSLVFAQGESSEFKRFVLSLLSDVSKRPSASQALQDPWLVPSLVKLPVIQQPSAPTKISPTPPQQPPVLSPLNNNHRPARMIYNYYDGKIENRPAWRR